MGTQRIPTRSNGQPIDESWFNRITQALFDYVVPRDASGEVGNIQGALGSPTLRWLKAFIACGYWKAGDFKFHHSYNGAAGPGQGWMLCDGRLINQTNYDAEHGSGAWAAYVGTSPLSGKYLPNAANKYLVGKSTTPQDGSSAISSVGNSSHLANIEHLHTAYKYNGASSPNTTFDSNGAEVQVEYNSQPNMGGSVNYLEITSGISDSAKTFYTKKAGSTAKSIQPESIEVQLYMRII